MDITRRLRNHAMPDPNDEREVMHAPLLREAADEIERLRNLLQRGQMQLEKWQDKYGEYNPPWLPPAGDVRFAEDAREALTPPNAQVTGAAPTNGERSDDL